MQRGIGLQCDRDGIPDDKPERQFVEVGGRHQFINLGLENGGDIIAMLRDQFASHMKRFCFVNRFHSASVIALDRPRHTSASRGDAIAEPIAAECGEVRMGNLASVVTSRHFAPAP